ncbi:Interleukin-18-binding protein, partial [Galemys pyrenaicus]
PSAVQVLLLCAHNVFHLAGAIANDPGSSWLPTAKRCPALEVTWPELEGPLSKEWAEGKLWAQGTQVRFPHVSILYRLGNGSFIEHLPGQLLEGSTSRIRHGPHTLLQRALVLEMLSPALRSTNFSCVFVDPGQVAQRYIVLAQRPALGEEPEGSFSGQQEELCSSVGWIGGLCPEHPKLICPAFSQAPQA